MSIEDTIRRMREDNKAARERSHDQTRRLISVALGQSDETLDEILEGPSDDSCKGRATYPLKLVYELVEVRVRRSECSEDVNRNRYFLSARECSGHRQVEVGTGCAVFRQIHLTDDTHDALRDLVCCKT